jgi:hypothetical protein
VSKDVTAVGNRGNLVRVSFHFATGAQKSGAANISIQIHNAGGTGHSIGERRRSSG